MSIFAMHLSVNSQKSFKEFNEDLQPIPSIDLDTEASSAISGEITPDVKKPRHKYLNQACHCLVT